MLIKVPEYEYTNKNGKVVKVPAYSYERSGSAKEKTMAKVKAIREATGEKETESPSEGPRRLSPEFLKKMMKERTEKAEREKQAWVKRGKRGIDPALKDSLEFKLHNGKYSTARKLAERFIKDPKIKAEWIARIDREAQHNYEQEKTTFTNLGLRRKTPEELANDFIDLKDFTQQTHDFKEQDFTVLHGPITRAGGFEYTKNGEKKVLYKQWDNIKERFAEKKYIPLKATTKTGSHKAKEVGFAYNWEPNDKTKQMYADVVLIEDIEVMTDLLDPKEGYHVSIGFNDHIEGGNKQIIDSLDHLAMSLKNKEVGRCSTAGGKGCTIKKKDTGMEMVI